MRRRRLRCGADCVICRHPCAVWLCGCRRKAAVAGHNVFRDPDETVLLLLLLLLLPAAGCVLMAGGGPRRVECGVSQSRSICAYFRARAHTGPAPDDPRVYTTTRRDVCVCVWVVDECGDRFFAAAAAAAGCWLRRAPFGFAVWYHHNDGGRRRFGWVGWLR